MIFYTYLWRDSAGVPFYVGKGHGKRAWSVLRRSKDFMYIYDQGGCTVEIVDEFIHESEAHAHEVELISKYGRQDIGGGTLVNKTDGGEGTVNPSEDTRAKRSAALKGRKMPPEAVAKTAAALRGRKRPPEVGEKIRAARLGKPAHPQTRELLAFMGRNMSDETRAKLSRASKGRKHSEETKAKQSAWHKGRKRPPEVMAKAAATRRLTLPTGTSGFKGVRLDKSTNKWLATAPRSSGSKQRHLGTFLTKEDAARAYDVAAYAEWGEDCYLNFPELLKSAA